MRDSTRSVAANSFGRPRRSRPGAAGLVGTSFKHEHLAAILEDGLQDGFFEVHAENYMGAGGPSHRALGAIRDFIRAVALAARQIASEYETPPVEHTCHEA